MVQGICEGAVLTYPDVELALRFVAEVALRRSTTTSSHLLHYLCTVGVCWSGSGGVGDSLSGTYGKWIMLQQ